MDRPTPRAPGATEEPIRLFRSDALEFFTHISPITVLVIWVPVLAIIVLRAVRQLGPEGDWAPLPAGFVLGGFLWTLAEYTLHRFLFHHRTSSDSGKRLMFLIHGIHHAQPQCKTRLVMPLVISVPMAVVLYTSFRLVLGELLGLRLWADPLFAGFLAGYIAYDMTHYALHHAHVGSPVGKALRRNHMKHHYGEPGLRFGISTTLWDHVFGTRPTGRPARP